MKYIKTFVVIVSLLATVMLCSCGDDVGKLISKESLSGCKVDKGGCFVEVYQDKDNVLTVKAYTKGNSKKALSYEVAFDKKLTGDDVYVEWLTNLGKDEPSEKDPYGIANVALTYEEKAFSERSINFKRHRINNSI